MRHWLWKDTLNNVGMYDSVWMPLHAIGSVVLIYIICTVIDYLRIRFIETPFFKLWDKKWDSISRRFNGIENRICNKLKISN